MKNTIFTGAGVAIVTPFTETGIASDISNEYLIDEDSDLDEKINAEVEKKLREEDLNLKIIEDAKECMTEKFIFTLS